MVILGRGPKPGAQGQAGGWPPAPDRGGMAENRLCGACIEVAGLEESVRFYNSAFGLHLGALLDVGQQPRATLVTDLVPGSFRLELLAPPMGTTAGTAGTAGTAVNGSSQGFAPPQPQPSLMPQQQAEAGGGQALEQAPAAAAGPGAGAGAGAAAGQAVVGFGHFTLAVPDTGVVLDALKAGGCGGLVVEECAAVIPVRSHGQSYTDRTSVVLDINGYRWQLMEVHSSKVRERMCSIMIHVADLRASLAFYTGALGMQVHQQYESHDTGYLSALVGYGPEMQCTLLELRQQRQEQQQQQPQQQALQQQQVAAAPAGACPRLCRFMVETSDLQEAAGKLQALGRAFERVQLPGSEDPTGGVQAVAVADADGWQFCLVQAPREQAQEQGREAAAMEE